MKYLFIILLPALWAACQTKSDPTASPAGAQANPTAANPAKKIVIALQPLHQFPAAATAAIQEQVARFYKAELRVLPEVTVPDAFITTAKGKRYRADSIIHWLQTNRPPGVDYVAGLTTKDISTTKYDAAGNMLQPAERYADWGVFGLGYQPGVSCVISVYRLQNGTAAQVNERLAKVTLHELGHNMGLPHCPNSCFMHDAVEKLSTVDNEPMNLCNDCKRKLHIGQ